ncbi:hypothetical protein AMTRI_Chr01g131360 [Amborella trichopoda]
MLFSLSSKLKAFSFSLLRGFLRHPCAKPFPTQTHRLLVHSLCLLLPVSLFPLIPLTGSLCRSSTISCRYSLSLSMYLK